MLVVHLLITFACSSKPTRRGEVYCAVEESGWRYSWKTRPVISRSCFWVEVGIPEYNVSQT